jgi:SAM-dependent methyltransferase
MLISINNVVILVLYDGAPGLASAASMSVPRYDKAFIQYTARSSAYAAGVVTSHLAPMLGVASVLDVGCALGTWLRAWSERGVADGHGIDGDYIDRAMLEIPQERFTAIDLNRGFDLGRQFDLVQSLEVAEHIAPRASDAFVDCLARHACRFVLFSAAPPGQGGEFHVNERPFEYWRSALARHGFVAIDAVRPAIAGDAKISYWYRYNIFLYLRLAELGKLDRRLSDLVVPEGTPLADLAPLAFRIRKAIVRQLPSGLQNGVARLKAKFMPTGQI